MIKDWFAHRSPFDYEYRFAEYEYEDFNVRTMGSLSSPHFFVASHAPKYAQTKACDGILLTASFVTAERDGHELIIARNLARRALLRWTRA